MMVFGFVTEMEGIDARHNQEGQAPGRDSVDVDV